MTQRWERKPQGSEERSASRGSLKLFYNETEDEHEESKIQQHEHGFQITSNKVLENPKKNTQQQNSQTLQQPNPNYQYNSQQQSEDQNSEFSYDEELQLLQVNYQMMRLMTVIENCYEQFVNIECIFQPNILNDIGRLRFIMVSYIESMIESSIDDNGEFDSRTYLQLICDETSVEHFIHLQYPFLDQDYDQQEEVQKYQQMTDEEFQDEFIMLNTKENIQQIVEYVNIEKMLFEQANENTSKKQKIKQARDCMVGPLDKLMKGGNEFMKSLGDFGHEENNNSLKEKNFKVQIRKQTNKKDLPIPKSFELNTHQQKNSLKLFNVQPINIHQADEIYTKDLTYKDFVSILKKQEQQLKQKQKQDFEKQKQKQKKLQEQNKKSQFDQILGRKDDQLSKSYLKPFIGEFKKKDSDNQLRDILGLGDTPKKEEMEVAEHSTPHFKQNLVQSQERIPSLSIHKAQNPGQIKNPMSLHNICSKTTQKSPLMNPSFLQKSTMIQSMPKITVPNVGSIQNPFLSNNRNIQNKNPQITRSMSPPSIVNPSNQIQRNSIMNNQGQMPLNQQNSQQTSTVLRNLQNPNFLHNQNDFVSTFTNQSFQNTNISKGENLNSKSPFQNLKNLEQNPSSNIFSNLQTNQNIKNKNPPKLQNLQNPQTQNQEMRSQSFSNNAFTFMNPPILQNQPQIFQKQQNQSNFPPQPQMSHINGSYNHFIPQVQTNINQNFNPQSANLSNFPTPSINGFLGQQKALNPGFLSLSIPQTQPINHPITHFVPKNVQKMSPQENQMTEKTESKKSGSNQEKKHPQSSLRTKQTSDKINMYDNSVLQNIKLKDFVQIFCQQELRKCYEDLYSELLLLKRWKVLNFGIDAALPEKLHYLSNRKTVKRNDLFMKMLQREEYKINKKYKDEIQTEPFCQMKVLHKKIEQINEQTIFDPFGLQKNSQLSSHLRVPKITKFEVTQIQFSRIEQIQQTLQQKVTKLETALSLGSQKNDNICCEGYLSIDEELSSIGLTLESVEKWIQVNGLCQGSEDDQLRSSNQNSSSLKSERNLIFDGLCQLYANISRIDTDLEIMAQRVQQFKK